MGFLSLANNIDAKHNWKSKQKNPPNRIYVKGAKSAPHCTIYKHEEIIGNIMMDDIKLKADPQGFNKMKIVSSLTTQF